MAERGAETLRHGPMKPMGLTNAHNPTVKAYAVVQLRQDNALGTLYNMVGFQTKLKYGEQVRVFRTIPGPGECRVRAARRPAPQHLHQLADAARPIAAAEVAARACASPARSPAAKAMSKAPRSACWPAASPPPSGSARRCRCRRPTTAFGALLNHITGGHIVSDDEPGKRSFQPMNINFGLFPPVEAPKAEGKRLRGKDKTVAKKAAMTARALADCRQWLGLPARPRRLNRPLATLDRNAAAYVPRRLKPPAL